MKNPITILLLVILPLLTTSQNRFAVFGGINNSTLSDGFLEKVPIGKSFGFHFGALYEYPFNEKIAFRPKLVFSLQGDREKTNNTYIDASSIDYKLTYINIPVNLKFFSRPYIIAGLQIGFLITTSKGDIDFGDVKTNLDYGVNFGLGYDINNFFVEINLYQGFATLVEIEDRFAQSVEVDATNTVFQLSLGYYFE